MDVVSSELSSFSTRPLILSGPVALLGFMFCKSFVMPLSVMLMFDMVGCGDGPLSGMGMSDVSVVNAFSNCLLRMLAFNCVLSVRTPLSRKEGMPVLSFLALLM